MKGRWPRDGMYVMFHGLVNAMRNDKMTMNTK